MGVAIAIMFLSGIEAEIPWGVFFTPYLQHTYVKRLAKNLGKGF